MIDSTKGAPEHGGDREALGLRVAELERALAERDQTVAALRQELASRRTLEREQQQLIAVMDTCSDFIGLADAHGRAHYVNEAGRNMVGLDDMDAVRRSAISDYFTPEDAAFVAQHIVPEVSEKGVWQGDFRFRHMKTGAIIPVHYNLFTVKDPETGEILGFATVTRDMSERKRAEEAEARLKDELIRAQAAALERLSTPLIPITEDVVVMPLVGTVDSRRAQQVMESLLRGVVDHRAQTVILDITGVSAMDTGVADALIRSAQAVQLLGARTVLTGISPHMAQILVGLGIDLGGIITQGTLQSGIAWATAEKARRALAPGGRKGSA